jgi:hypothetical protein
MKSMTPHDITGLERVKYGHGRTANVAVNY